jgi:hypothetical protein
MKLLKTIVNKILKKITFAILIYKLNKNLCEDTGWTFKHNIIDNDLYITYYTLFNKFSHAVYITKPINPFKHYNKIVNKALGGK